MDNSFPIWFHVINYTTDFICSIHLDLYSNFFMLLGNRIILQLIYVELVRMQINLFQSSHKV